MMIMKERAKHLKVCVVTGTRADWGLLSPLARALASHADCSLTVIATNMHLSEVYGMTVREIIADGFNPLEVPMDAIDDRPASRVHAMAQCMNGMADAFATLSPDIVVILGDRYEMLAVASAASVMHIPIVHIAGGAISEGAIDDSIRHAITKLSAIHLVETESYRRRVIAMGERPERVIYTGAIGVWNIMNVQLMSRDELDRQTGMRPGHPYAVVTFHPATLDTADAGLRCRAMLDALDRHADIDLLLTYPNNDSGSVAVIREIKAYAEANPERVTLIKSLGLCRYLSALKYAEFYIGNSSSGIVEVPSMGIPTIDIGIRQRGRVAADSVIHCGNSADEIDAAIKLAMSHDFKTIAARRNNPYYKPDTLSRMVDIIMALNPHDLQLKQFYDIPTL